MSDTPAGQLTAEQAREIALFPDRWSSYFRTIEGKPFRLDERPYLQEVYRHFGATEKSETTKVIVLKCSRKVEKTETICNLLLYALLNIPYFNAVYTAPRQPQVSRFVEERFNGAMMSSVNGGCLLKQRLKTSVSHQTFDVGAKSLNHFYAYSNWGDAHGLLGIAADMCCIDEYQDSDPDVLPMLMEMLAQSDYKWVVVSGTAREQGSEFWRLWSTSTKAEWNAKDQEWVHKKAEAPNIIGYHITQLMHPDITDEDIAQKKITYTPRRFANEVLGEFFSGSAKPLTLDQALKVIDRNMTPLDSINPPEKTFMGVDWGLTTTVIIMRENGDIVNAFKIESRGEDDMDEVGVLKDMIVRFNCVSVVCDIGYGARQVRELQREFGDRVKSCYYASRPMTPFEFKKRDNNRNLIHMAVIDRTSYIEETVEAIKNGEIRLPWQDRSLEWVLEEFCAINSSAETDMKSGRQIRGQTLTKYGRDGDDHALHSLLYARLAVEMESDGGLPTMRTFGA
tara:strand:- start:2538 stop:4064 length:1527 start_codon:yes stop_codon:yes gene_type:complete